MLPVSIVSHDTTLGVGKLVTESVDFVLALLELVKQLQCLIHISIVAFGLGNRFCFRQTSLKGFQFRNKLSRGIRLMDREKRASGTTNLGFGHF
jgi:hypothetical protein